MITTSLIGRFVRINRGRGDKHYEVVGIHISHEMPYLILMDHAGALQSRTLDNVIVIDLEDK